LLAACLQHPLILLKAEQHKPLMLLGSVSCQGRHPGRARGSVCGARPGQASTLHGAAAASQKRPTSLLRALRVLRLRFYHHSPKGFMFPGQAGLFCYGGSNKVYISV